MNESNFSSDLPREVVEAFISAAITALQELMQFEALVEELSAVLALEMTNVVSATVRLVRTEPGKLTVVLTEESASRLAARFLPKETLLTEEIVNDVTGEIANVIAGQAKTTLKGTPYHFKMSTPVVARESSVSDPAGVVATTLVASLTFESGRMKLFVNLSACPGA
jgi:CheY-specific phosphatase CheX